MSVMSVIALLFVAKKLSPPPHPCHFQSPVLVKFKPNEEGGLSKKFFATTTNKGKIIDITDITDERGGGVKSANRRSGGVK
jgi:hypothetical protein